MTRAVNFRMDESQISDMKRVASVYHMTVTDVIQKAVADYLDRLKADPYYRLTVNVEQADADEENEILDALDSLTDDDLTIVRTEQVRL